MIKRFFLQLQIFLKSIRFHQSLRLHAFHMMLQIFMDNLTDKLSLTSEQLDKLMDAFLLGTSKTT